ncbi:tRNA/rRNA methyltransferase SpoU [Penicillium alfredii]|uniref:rRNA methyltransferase 1, mitochondrial n=1 Tax=Penicillium alfredii TaxID=1506179 RepID=A0A9W9ERR9_9EURO|nr:tRNA/rRNA methyltransferase SpoU [Penicillium alfredii]KAJ5086812.1 tRNA/rRNA methyltransferase SpoU [Penicillium alfredii]
MGWIPRTALHGQFSWLTKSSPTWVSARHASLNSAIGRGIRRSQADTGDRRRPLLEESQHRLTGQGNRPNTRQRPGQTFGQKSEPRLQPKSQQRFKQRPNPSLAEFDEDEFIRTGNIRPLQKPHDDRDDGRSRLSGKRPAASSDEASASQEPGRRKARDKNATKFHRATDSMPERVKENVKVPTSIPYTSPASEFIYGTGAIEAALRCSRRQLYKLYLYQGADEELSPAKVSLRKLALSKDIGVKMAFAGWDRLLDKMSAGRPHNGCILEASPLPKLPVRGLCSVPSVTESHFRVELAPQTREELAVNGANDQIPILHPTPLPYQEHQTHRYPVTLLLDGVVDPGNMGAIIRSAYYLGIDAIVFAGRNSAPLSPVTIKASAGAAENMALLHVKNEVDFIQRSKSNGWRFYAADAPSPGCTYLDRPSVDKDGSGHGFAVNQSPSVLMMGSEGSGLSPHIKSQADSIVGIPGARHSPVLGVQSDPARIDSLNVSVAAALLMETFLRTPFAVSKPAKKEKQKEKSKPRMK